MKSLCLLAATSLLAPLAVAATYEVGPGQRLKTISGVPWATLAPGDTVNIHWAPVPYQEKWVICRAGTAEAPITVHGVPGPKGELPLIDGDGAVTVHSLDYWGENRSILKIGGASIPKDCMPANIIIDGLEFANARPPFTFQGRKKVAPYVEHASAIWVEKGDHITIRNCTIHDSANGLFVGSKSKIVVVEHCNVYGNGVEKSGFEHNVYTEADGIIFEGNHFGPLRAECPGNNLKDRSAGTIIRNNWIEGGNRELDLVDAEDSAQIRKSPDYGDALVYGNVIIEPRGDGHDQIVHFGGDSAHPEWYRNGTLHFFNNTVISQRPDSTTLFWLSSNDQHVDARNNIFYTIADGKTLAVLNDMGQATLSMNWFKPGWTEARSMLAGGSVKTEGTNLEGSDPDFVNLARNDFHLAPASPCVGGAAALPKIKGLEAEDHAVSLGAFGIRQ